MSKLFAAAQNETVTENNAVAFKSTLDKNVDLFFKAGASRRDNLSALFEAAYKENKEYATRIALWTRDVRGGAGERQQFRNFLASMINYDPAQAHRILTKIPEVGRFDDLMVFWNTELEVYAAAVWVQAIRDGNGLAAKWAPRKDSKGAKPLRKFAHMSEAKWRKFVVEKTEVVEQLMCANKWDEIDYEKIPSLASARYNAAFNRHDPLRREEFRQKLESGEAKVNAGAVYPYDLVRAANYDDRVATAQWNALPDYLEGTDERFLPVVDVSGSMGIKVSGDISAMDVSVSLGMYLAERNRGIFRDQIVTFSDRPDFVTIKGKTLNEKANFVRYIDWGMSTNIEAVFDKLLATAKRNNLVEADMPTKILILSDMQFNVCVKGGNTFYESFKEKYETAGYQLPQVVFWNIAGHDKGNVPVTYTTNGTALVSGFSPAIMKSLIGGNLNPMSVMLEAIMNDRYNF